MLSALNELRAASVQLVIRLADGYVCSSAR